MKILISDSGSTKTDWCLLERLDGDEFRVSMRTTTQGMNPVHQERTELVKILEEELLPHLPLESSSEWQCFFYGAGCVGDHAAMLKTILSELLPIKMNKIEVASDLLAAARALCGNQEGIACILGTGSNSCYYNGTDIVDNIPPLGYILGDEGSGAVLGRMFLNALYKGDLPADTREILQKETGLTYVDIINKVYRQPMANRFLASLTRFIAAHMDLKGMRELVIDNFRSFLRKNVLKYGRKDLPVGAVGSVAYYFQEEFYEALMMEECLCGTILQAPMNGLISYHSIIPQK